MSFGFHRSISGAVRTPRLPILLLKISGTRDPGIFRDVCAFGFSPLTQDSKSARFTAPATLSPARGFTLLEVLIALAVLAIALGAAVRAVGSVTDQSFAAKQRILANWVAQNQLAEHIALRDWPEPGEKSGKTGQGANNWRWRETVSATPNAGFRRIEIKVGADGDNDYVIARLIGYLADPANDPP